MSEQDRSTDGPIPEGMLDQAVLGWGAGELLPAQGLVAGELAVLSSGRVLKALTGVFLNSSGLSYSSGTQAWDSKPLCSIQLL